MIFQVVNRSRIEKSLRKENKNLVNDGGDKVDEINFKDHPKIIWSERTFLNTLEQGPIFILSFWLFTVFLTWVLIIF